MPLSPHTRSLGRKALRRGRCRCLRMSPHGCVVRAPNDRCLVQINAWHYSCSLTCQGLFRGVVWCGGALVQATSPNSPNKHSVTARSLLRPSGWHHFFCPRLPFCVRQHRAAGTAAGGGWRGVQPHSERAVHSHASEYADVCACCVAYRSPDQRLCILGFNLCPIDQS